MPKGGGSKKKASKEPSAAQKSKNIPDTPENLEKELELKAELKRIKKDVASLRLQTSELSDENEWLLQEKETTQLETQEYMGYMSKRTQKRQSFIVSLSDENRKQLEQVHMQKEELVKDYEQRKSRLRNVLIDREADLAKMKAELRDLQQYKLLQRQQEAEIMLLEKQLEERRFQHESMLRTKRANFLRQRQVFENEYDNRKKAMSSTATQEAADALRKQSERIRAENKQLRQELNELIHITQDLQSQKTSLHRQLQVLLREKQVQEELDKLKMKRAGLTRM